MKRQHLLRLGTILGSFRNELSPPAFDELIKDVGELCAEVNPAFDMTKFRETVLSAKIKSLRSAPVAINPLAQERKSSEGEK